NRKPADGVVARALTQHGHARGAQLSVLLSAPLGPLSQIAVCEPQRLNALATHVGAASAIALERVCPTVCAAPVALDVNPRVRVKRVHHALPARRADLNLPPELREEPGWKRLAPRDPLEVAGDPRTGHGDELG